MQNGLSLFATGYMVMDACWILSNPSGVKSPKTVLVSRFRRGKGRRGGGRGGEEGRRDRCRPFPYRYRENMAGQHHLSPWRK